MDLKVVRGGMGKEGACVLARLGEGGSEEEKKNMHIKQVLM